MININVKGEKMGENDVPVDKQGNIKMIQSL